MTDLPSPVLRPFIRHYAGFRAEDVPPGTDSALPSRHVHLIINLTRPINVIRMPDPTQSPAEFTALVSGLQDAPATVLRGGDMDGLHVFLTPLGIRALFGVTSAELMLRVVDLRDLWGSAADNLIERLQCARAWRRRFDILDEVLAGVLRPFEPAHELVWAWRRLARAHGSVPIQQVSDELGWSRRHFSEKFRAELGLTPKTAARIFRFERACRLIMDERPGLADVAFACGYQDQAHMTREWNSLAGCTPRTWIANELPFLQDYEVAAEEDDGRH